MGFFLSLLALGLFCGLWVVDENTAARGFADSTPAFGVLGQSATDAQLYLLGREIPLPMEALNTGAGYAQKAAVALPPFFRLVGQGLTALYFLADDYLGHTLPFTAEQALWEQWR